jgi:hypothetical protein
VGDDDHEEDDQGEPEQKICPCLFFHRFLLWLSHS